MHTVEYLRQMYAEGANHLCLTVINDLHIVQFIPPTEPGRTGLNRNQLLHKQCRKQLLL